MKTKELEKLRIRVAEAKPENWLSKLSILADNLDTLGFDNLMTFITTPFLGGGLGMTEDLARAVIYADPNEVHRMEDIAEDHPEIMLLKANNIKPINAPSTGVRDERENITHSDRGTSFNYKIGKLKRDFGDDAVMGAIEENGYTKATEVERHFGVGKPLLTDVEKVIRAYNRLSDEEKKEFLENK